MTETAKQFGERGLPGRREIVDQHQREERRFRTDALRAGLGVLARTYGGRVTTAALSGTVEAGDPDVRAAAAAIGLITETVQALPRNPSESLLLRVALPPPRRLAAWRAPGPSEPRSPDAA